MRGAQYRRKRPTMQTAHDFFRFGEFLTDPKLHYLSGEEREAEIDNARDELLAICQSQFPRTQNLEFAILKAHLIVEHAIVQFIRCFASVSIAPDQVRFTFRQKLEMAYLLGFGANDPIVLPTVERLNAVRN
jgi:hypothetical protein